MPYINIKLTSPMPSQKKLDLVAQQITQIMVNELGKTAQRVIINYEAADPDAFYFGGESVTQIKAKKSPKVAKTTKLSKTTKSTKSAKDPKTTAKVAKATKTVAKKSAKSTNPKSKKSKAKK